MPQRVKRTQNIYKDKNMAGRIFFRRKSIAQGYSSRSAGRQLLCKIWNMLCLIPYGETTTYGELAKSIAAERGLKKMSAQAIGGAVGSNPIAIIIPCHRVIGVKGNLTGFGGGLDLKIKLLQIEKAYKPYFFAPNIKKSNNHHKKEPKQMHLDAIA